MNATVTLTGIQITTTNLGLPESPDWYAWYNERDLQASGNASSLLEIDTIDLYFGTLSQSGEANYTLAGTSNEIITADILALASANKSIDGIESEIIAGEVSASAITPVSQTFVLDGISVNTALGNVKATEQSAEILRLSGNPRRYSVQIKNANLNLRSIQAKIEASTLNAFGTTVISANIGLMPIDMSVNEGQLTADGVLDISEEELVLFLMAA